MREKCLTIEEIASDISQSVKFVRREIASGNLKSHKTNNKTMVAESDYADWKKRFRKKDGSAEAKANTAKPADEVNWIDVSEEMEQIDGWKNRNQIGEFNFIDLFTGAGGLSCGLVMAGMKPVGSVEIMPQAVETYKYNFYGIDKLSETSEACDIRDEEVKRRLIASAGGTHVHLIAGGFPCQGFSMAGNRIIADPRNSLYLEMLDVVKEIKPDFILMENVEGLRTMSDGKIEEKIISDYLEIGYAVNVTVLNSADYGVPQLRRRVIFIGNRINAVNYHPRPVLNKDDYVTVGDALSKYLDMPEDKSINHEFMRSGERMLQRLRELPVGQSLYGNYSDAWKKVEWDKPSCTVKENHGGVNVHPILNRVMTPRELAALQSFPDDFIFKGSKKWQLVQIGNAVPPLLAKAVGLAIKKSYDEVKK